MNSYISPVDTTIQSSHGDMGFSGGLRPGQAGLPQPHGPIYFSDYAIPYSFPSFQFSKDGGCRISPDEKSRKKEFQEAMSAILASKSQLINLMVMWLLNFCLAIHRSLNFVESQKLLDSLQTFEMSVRKVDVHRVRMKRDMAFSVKKTSDIIPRNLHAFIIAPFRVDFHRKAGS